MRLNIFGTIMSADHLPRKAISRIETTKVLFEQWCPLHFNLVPEFLLDNPGSIPKHWQLLKVLKNIYNKFRTDKKKYFTTSIVPIIGPIINEYLYLLISNSFWFFFGHEPNLQWKQLIFVYQTEQLVIHLLIESDLSLCYWRVHWEVRNQSAFPQLDISWILISKGSGNLIWEGHTRAVHAQFKKEIKISFFLPNSFLRISIALNIKGLKQKDQIHKTAVHTV